MRRTSTFLLSVLAAGCGAPVADLAQPTLSHADHDDALTSALCASDFRDLLAWNVVSAGDIRYRCSDFEGAILAGGNIDLANMAVGMAGAGNGAAAIAGGWLALDRGSIVGDVYAQGAVWLDHYCLGAQQAGWCSATGRVYCGGGVSRGEGNDAGDGLTRWSFPTQQLIRAGTDVADRIAMLAAAPVAADAAGQIALHTTATGLQVFAVDPNGASGLSISAPAGATVVVRVDGTAPRLVGLGEITLAGGIASSAVLFVFPEALDLRLAAVVLPGAVLAPRAAVQFDEGRVECGVYAGSLQGGTQSGVTCGTSGGQVNWGRFAPPVCTQ